MKLFASSLTRCEKSFFRKKQITEYRCNSFFFRSLNYIYMYSIDNKSILVTVNIKHSLVDTVVLLSS